MYLKLEIRVMCREFYRNKSDDYLYLYIRNLENSRLKPFFGTQNPFVFVWAGREH